MLVKSKAAFDQLLLERKRVKDASMAAIGQRIKSVLEHVDCTDVDEIRGGYWVIGRNNVGNNSTVVKQLFDHCPTVSADIWSTDNLVEYCTLLNKEHQNITYHVYPSSSAGLLVRIEITPK